MKDENFDQPKLNEKDIYKRITGKIETKDDALMVVHVFRLTINYLTLYRHEGTPRPIYSGDIYCVVEGIGDPKAYPIDEKWITVVYDDGFIENYLDEINWIKKSIDIYWGGYRYSLINYYDTKDVGLRPISEHHYIKSIKNAIKENSFLESDKHLESMGIGINFLYGKSGLNMKNLSAIKGFGNPLKLYAERIKIFAPFYGIIDTDFPSKKATEEERDVVNTLLFVLPYDKRTRK